MTQRADAEPQSSHTSGVVVALTSERLRAGVAIARLREDLLGRWSRIESPAEILLRCATALVGTTIAPSRMSIAVLPAYAAFDGLHVLWTRERPTETETVMRPLGFLEEREHLESPLHEVQLTARPLRVRLDRDPHRFPFLGQLALDGATDYVALPLPGHHAAHPILTVATQRAGGWSDDDLDALRALTPIVSLLIEVCEGRRLASLASTDALTGLPNRRSFEVAFRQAASTCQRGGLPLSLLVFDVDHFKGFNDSYGHPAGDRCLARIAGASAHAVKRGHDVVARLGGEEFAVLLPACDEAGAQVVAERIRASVEALAIPHARGAAGGRVTVSIGGVSTRGRAGSDRVELLAIADRALYGAKTGGRNCVRFDVPREDAADASAS